MRKLSKVFSLMDGFVVQNVSCNKYKKAFTLAEVLITLGIIGIVTAITVPTLIKKYQEDTWNTSANIFEKKLDDALQTMNTQSALAGHKTTKEFIKELSKHFKITRICEGDKLLNCFTDVIWFGSGTATPEEIDMTKITQARHFGQKDWNTDLVGVQFVNGINALIAYNPLSSSDDGGLVCSQTPYSNQVPVKNCLAILYDTSGAKNPNMSGKDIRSINVLRLGSTCTLEIGRTCYSSLAFVPTPMTYAECAGENAVKAGTTVKAGAEAKKLGIEYCSYANDYWAGAVRQCGGVDKMPSLEEATALSAYLYGFKNASKDGTTYCPTDANGDYTYCRNTDLTKSLGFNLTSDTKTVHLWTGDEPNNRGKDAYYKNINARALGTYYSNTRSQSAIYAFCKSN